MRPEHWLFTIPLRLRSLFRLTQADQELDDELRDHLERKTEEYVAKGTAPDEARRRARLDLGGIEQTKEKCRDARRVSWMQDLIQDLHYGLRILRKSPGFTAVAVLTLALGIGPTTAIFNILEAVLLRPLPFKDPSRLVILHEGIPKMGYPKMDFSPADLAVFVRAQKSFDAIGSFQNEHVNISGEGEPERITSARVSASLFPMLGAEPMLGRTFSPEEDAPGHPFAMLSYGLWQRRYGGAPNIVGRTIELDRQPYLVIGVMPREFVFPLAGPEVNGFPADLWVPMAFTSKELQEWGGSYFTSVVGRLRPGITLAQARGENDALARRIIDSYPAIIAEWARQGQLAITVSPFQEDLVGSVRTLLLVLMAAVSFVLLIASANVATLFLSRAAARQREIAVRTALGATRLRLVRQMLTESLLLAIGAGALGFLLGLWARDLLLALVPPSIALPHHISVNAGVLAFAIGIALLTALLFGIAPVFQAPFASVQGSLRESGRSATPSRSHHRLQGFFVTAEFALALVLLVGAGLLIRSLAKLLEADPGFRPDHILTLSVPLPRQAYPHAEQVESFYRELLDRISNLPGVESASVSNDLPLNAREEVSINIEGKRNAEGQTPQAICQSWLMGNYFQAMGIPLLEGRWFTAQDRSGSEQVAIVSLSAAKKFWPGEDAIGKRIRWGVNGPWEIVIGVVGDVSQGPLNQPLIAHVYRPYDQVSGPFLEQDPFGDWHAMNLALRTQSDPASLASAAVAQVHSLDADLPVSAIRTMTQVMSSSLAGPKFNTLLLGIFAGMALFLAAIGIYGVLAYAVAQHTHEIGVRMALGAHERDVLRLILKQGARLALVGVGCGAIVAVFLTRLMASLLYGVSPMDPITFVSIAGVLIAVALLACYFPARRAMRVDPMVALRYE
jgi:putative ABC transport system permease protein